MLIIKDEAIDYIFNEINTNNALDFDGCFCGLGEFYLGEVNNEKLYLAINTSCCKGNCDNGFYEARIAIASEVTDKHLIREFARWHEGMACEDFYEEGLFHHNFKDVILQKRNDYKLSVNTEMKVRAKLYEKYVDYYNSDPFDYDENFKI